ncbi:MAG TPA: hypothetical protein VF712_10735 [Thermoleophilaceae bacterium]
MAEQREPGEPQQPDDERADKSEEQDERKPEPRDAQHEPSRRGRDMPAPDPSARIRKRFIIGRDGEEPPLVVTVENGAVASNYAPAELVAKLTERVAVLLKEMGGGVGPMFYAAVPGGSIHLIFGDPDPDEAQATLPMATTAAQAERVAELIDLEGDELFARALQIGRPMRQYDDLAQLVLSEGITLRWTVQGDEPRVLSPARADRQHLRLSAPPELKDRDLTVHGVLYRVITESTREGFLGSVGIHLHSWSTRPPGDKSKTRLIAFYEKRSVEAEIKEGLIGEPVTAKLLIRQPLPGTTIEPERFDLVLDDLEPGPPEDDRMGLFEEIE